MQNCGLTVVNFKRNLSAASDITGSRPRKHIKSNLIHHIW